MVGQRRSRPVRGLVNGCRRVRAERGYRVGLALRLWPLRPARRQIVDMVGRATNRHDAVRWTGQRDRAGVGMVGVDGPVGAGPEPWAQASNEPGLRDRSPAGPLGWAPTSPADADRRTELDIEQWCPRCQSCSSRPASPGEHLPAGPNRLTAPAPPGCASHPPADRGPRALGPWSWRVPGGMLDAAGIAMRGRRASRDWWQASTVCFAGPHWFSKGLERSGGWH